jgi:hypothetical protein
LSRKRNCDVAVLPPSKWRREASKHPCFFFFLVGFWQAPKAEDRAQVVSREVRLPNAPPTTLDDQDAQIVSSQAISIDVTRKWHFEFFNISIADSVAYGVLGPCSE